MSNQLPSARMLDIEPSNPMLSCFWLIYHRAHYLFEQGSITQQFVFDECCLFRDLLLAEIGSTYVPDHAPEKSPSVATAVLAAHANVQWLNERIKAHTMTKH